MPVGRFNAARLTRWSSSCGDGSNTAGGSGSGGTAGPPVVAVLRGFKQSSWTNPLLLSIPLLMCFSHIDSYTLATHWKKLRSFHRKPASCSFHFCRRRRHQYSPPFSARRGTSRRHYILVAASEYTRFDAPTVISAADAWNEPCHGGNKTVHAPRKIHSDNGRRHICGYSRVALQERSSSGRSPAVRAQSSRHIL